MDFYKDAYSTNAYAEALEYEEFQELLHSPPSDEEMKEMARKARKQDRLMKRRNANRGRRNLRREGLSEPDKIIPSSLW